MRIRGKSFEDARQKLERFGLGSGSSFVSRFSFGFRFELEFRFRFRLRSRFGFQFFSFPSITLSFLRSYLFELNTRKLLLEPGNRVMISLCEEAANDAYFTNHQSASLFCSNASILTSLAPSPTGAEHWMISAGKPLLASQLLLKPT